MNENIVSTILEQDWTFAKTMPQMPHEYSLRKKWKDEQDFIKAVLFIREHGYEKRFGSKTYRYYDIEGMCYWTMGNPIDKTILINRAKIK